jgi:hypothetical protein
MTFSPLLALRRHAPAPLLHHYRPAVPRALEVPLGRVDTSAVKT